MQKSRFILPLAAIFLALLVIRVLPWHSEPVYKGRTLSEWMDLATHAHNTAEADEALRSLGAKAVPYMMDWIKYDPNSTWHRSYLRAMRFAYNVSISREIESIRVLPLHGLAKEMKTIEDAISFINSHEIGSGCGPFVRYEIQIRYNNADSIEARFQDKQTAITFLRTYLPAKK